MKNALVILAVIGFCASCNSNAHKEPEHTLLGNWDSHSMYEGNPFVLEARFKPSGDYDGFGNGKHFVTGKYRLAGDTLFLKDALCNLDYEGVYTLTYFKDSIRFDVIEDTCMQRNNGTNKVAMGRIASTKK